MIAADFRRCADRAKQVWTKFHLRWAPHEQIAWWGRVTLPEAPAMPKTKRFAGRPINAGIETLFDLVEGRLVLPTWHDATRAIGRIDEHPATTVKDSTGMGQVNLVAFEGQ